MAELTAAAKSQLESMPLIVKWANELRWNEQTPLTLVIASADIDEANRAIREADEGPRASTETTTVQVGRRIRAELSGPNVKITKPDQTTRDVTRLQNVTMTWLVEPTRPGDTTLTLQVFNQLTTPAGIVEVERPAYRHTFKVSMPWVDWIKWELQPVEDARALLWALIGAPIVAVFMNRRKIGRWLMRRRRPA